jgi:hypothetical protein
MTLIRISVIWGVTIVYPMLTRMNNMEWSAVIRVNLHAVGLWEAIQYVDIEYCDDKLVLAVMLHAVPAKMQVSLTNKETGCEAWGLIRRVCIGVDCVKEANADHLRQEFTELKFKPREGVEDFSLRVTVLANELCVLGDDITDKEVMKKLLHSMPEKLEQVAILIETLLDLKSMLFEEAISHLLTVEQRRKKGATCADDAEGRLLMTKEEWTSCMKAKEKGSSSGGSTLGGGSDRDRGRSRGRGHVGRCNSGVNSNSHEDTTACGACHNCGKMGHFTR